MAEQQNNDIYKQASQAIFNKAAEKGVQKAVNWAATRTATKLAALPAGIVGQVGAELGTRGAEYILKNKGKAATGVASALAAPVALGMMFVAVIGAGLAALGSALMIGMASTILMIVFIFFIINNSALLVPPGGSITGGYSPGINVGASCPIPGAEILIGPYGHTDNLQGLGHGTPKYWSDIIPAGDQCTYRISGCFAKSTSDTCAQPPYNKTEICSTYGLAIDVIYSGGSSAGKLAYLPYLQGQEVSWEVVSVNPCNCAGTLRAEVNGQVYEMYISHLTAAPRGGVSGQPIGTIDSSAHVHIELSIDGHWVDPLSMCSGDSGAINQPTTSPSSSTPPTGSNSCNSSGGQCFNQSALSLLNPGSNPTTCEEANLTTVSGACGGNQLCCR